MFQFNLILVSTVLTALVQSYKVSDDFSQVFSPFSSLFWKNAKNGSSTGSTGRKFQNYAYDRYSDDSFKDTFYEYDQYFVNQTLSNDDFNNEENLPVGTSAGHLTDNKRDDHQDNQETKNLPPHAPNFGDLFHKQHLVPGTPAALPVPAVVGLGAAVAAILPLAALALYANGGLSYQAGLGFFNAGTSSASTANTCLVSTATSTVTSLSTSISTMTTTSTSVSTITSTSVTTTTVTTTATLDTVTSTIIQFSTVIQSTTIYLPTTITMTNVVTNTVTSTSFTCTSTSTVTATSTLYSNVTVTATSTLISPTTLTVPTTITITNIVVTSVICCECNSNNSNCNCGGYPKCSVIFGRRKKKRNAVEFHGQRTLPIEPTAAIIDIFQIQPCTTSYLLPDPNLFMLE